MNKTARRLYANVYRGGVVLSALLAIVLLAGCPQPVKPTNPVNPPPISSNANLDSCTILEDGKPVPIPTHAWNGKLFQPAETDYTYNVAKSVAQLKIAVKPADTNASVTINGIAGLSADITITGDMAIPIVVTPPSGATNAKTYTINVKRGAEVPVNILVTGSVNGSFVPGVTIKVYDRAGTELTAKQTNTDASGKAVIQLDEHGLYSFVSSKADYAESRVQNFCVRSTGNDISVINQKLGMTTRAAEAPTLTDILVTNDLNVDPVAYDPAKPLDTSGECYVFAVFSAKSAVSATAWSGFGAKLHFGGSASLFNGIEGLSSPPEPDPSDPNKWVVVYAFLLNKLAMPAGAHEAHIVAYDVANNRCETTVDMRFSHSTTASAVSEGTFRAMNMSITSYPKSRGWFSADAGIEAVGQYNGNDISYRTQLSFGFAKDNPDTTKPPIPIGIYGFDVFRSEDGTNFKKIGNVLYGKLEDANDQKRKGRHTFYDTDGRLETGKIYHYKVTVYTDAANTKESAAVQAYIPDPFHYTLTSPANNAQISAAAGTDYTFTLHNAAGLWDAAKSDYFNFGIIIRKRSGDAKLVKLRYNFKNSRFEVFLGLYRTLSVLKNAGILTSDVEADYFTYAAGLITIKAKFISEFLGQKYDAGAPYSWDIIGTYKGMFGDTAHSACWFEKTTTEGGTMASYGNTGPEGANADNGKFHFIVTP